MLAVLLALAAAAGYGGSDYTAGLAARQASVVRVTVLVEVTSAALLLCVIPFISSQGPTLTSVLWGAGAGASGVAGAMALYLGFRHAAFSVASSVSAVGSAAFSVLAGVARWPVSRSRCPPSSPCPPPPASRAGRARRAAMRSAWGWGWSPAPGSGCSSSA